MRNVEYAFAFVIVLLLLSTNCYGQKIWGYASPGVRFGYSFGEGPTFGVEVSLGAHRDDLNWHSAIVVGIEKYPDKHQSAIKYIAVQGGSGPFGGSFGLAHNTDYGFGKCFNVFCGIGYSFLSLKSFIFSSQVSGYDSIGIIWKYPILNVNFKPFGSFGAVYYD